MQRNKLLPFLAALLLVITISNVEAKGKKNKGKTKEVSEEWLKLYEVGKLNNLGYRLMKPAGFDESKKYPIIISLHGAGGKGKNNVKNLRDWNKQLTDQKIREDFPCYVLAPQSEKGWNGNHLKVIKEVISGMPAVDMNRIYIIGHSMGGQGTFSLIQKDPSYFAAAAPSAGGGKGKKSKVKVELIKDLPIWTFHGENDKVCPYASTKGIFEEMKKSGGNMKFTTWSKAGHGVSTKFIAQSKGANTEFSSELCDKEDDFMTWLFNQKRSE